MRVPIRVVKVGGSLLDLGDLATRMRQWLKAQTPAHHVIVVGGGALVEQVREWHRNDPIDDVAAHWMCIDLMSVTAHLLHSRMPEIALIEDDRLLCQRVGSRDCTIFGPANWMRHSEPYLPGTKLPASWDVTSDSIAARLAFALIADEIVLLKSSLPQKRQTNRIKDLAAGGYIDVMMAQLAHELPGVRVVNLRSNGMEELQLAAERE